MNFYKYFLFRCVQVAELELKQVLAGYPDCPAEAIHGSYFRNWSSIQQQGLSRMKRTHIHLAPGLPGEDGVVSGTSYIHFANQQTKWLNSLTDFCLPAGMRKDCDLVVYVDVPKALAGIFTLE